MKFVVDAHLPPGVCRLFSEAGHDAVHTLDLPARNQTLDRDLNDLSVREHRALISKDSDFYYSHLLHQRPLILKEATERVQSWFDQSCVRLVQPTDQHWTLFQQMLRSGNAVGNLVS